MFSLRNQLNESKRLFLLPPQVVREVKFEGRRFFFASFRRSSINFGESRIAINFFGYFNLGLPTGRARASSSFENSGASLKSISESGI